MSVSIYHEIFEAMTVSCPDPPALLEDFNEGDFERTGYEIHERLGSAAPEKLNTMLQLYGFPEE